MKYYSETMKKMIDNCQLRSGSILLLYLNLNITFMKNFPLLF